MENTEEIMQVLERFTRLKQKDIPKELDEYLQYVAKTGDTIFKWPTLKYLFREKFLSVIKHFHDTSPRVDDLPQYPNVDPFNYESLKSALLERLELFNAAPFTVQRLCELLIDPRKQYSRIDKFMRALEKNILVVSTVEPGRKRDESENGDSLDSVVNGDLSLDVNVDIDMESESIFNIDVKTKLSHTPLQQQSQQKSSSQSPTQIQQSSSSPVHRSDDEILPNPKKQKLDVEKVHENEFTDKIISPEKEPTIVEPAEDSNIIKISPNTENKEIYPSKETDEKNESESEIGVVKLTPQDANDNPQTEEKKVETAHFFADKIDNKTELVTIKKIIDSNNTNETSTSNYTDIDKTNSKETSFLQNEINNEERSNEADSLQLDSESKETAGTLETDIVSTLKDVNTKNVEEDNSFTPSKPETKVENENDSPAIHITSELENEKISENSKNEIASKNDENAYKESNNSTTVCVNENEISADTNSKMQSKIEEHEQVEKLEEKEEVFDEIVKPTKETVENILKIELPTTSAVTSSSQNDQPMEDNAENSLPPAVTINNISLVIPENTVSVEEVIMGDSLEMATDPVEPLIKDESASMEIDDTSQEAMDQ